ncbi:MAG: Ppx/GppA phosphatase family protein [Candidatus Obscuribacter sp.]|nr:Ppx/GppA family phosphatase [Candidatus Melainabacteria bacterium]MDX1989954.1 Ppx/GppA phosphatase family protein [Candidatus Obscuribacter sp.]
MSLKSNADKAKSPKGASSSGPVSLPSERKGSWVKVKGGPVVAVVDMGTNSFHMIVCQASPEKDHFEVLAKVKEAVPFFRRSLSAHYIDEQALRSALRILRDMLKNAREHGASYTMAVATSAVRESKNGEECLRRIRAELKMDARMISGKEEARLIYLGFLFFLTQFMPHMKGRFCIVDIGGGSTELIVGDEKRIYFAESYKLGAARLTQRFFKKGEVTPQTVQDLHNEVRGVLRPAASGISVAGGFDTLVGTSGTIQALAKLDRVSSGNPHAELAGWTIPLVRLEKLVDYIKAFALKGEKPKGVSADRNETILAGAIVLMETMKALGAGELKVSPHALREGVVVDRFLQTGWLDAGLTMHRDPRSMSVLNLLEKYQGSFEHAQQVAFLSQLLFTQTRGILHNHPEEVGHLLWSASMLHDLGMFVSRNGHHKHSYYLIKNGGLLGHSEEEVAIIAAIARYHRGSEPKVTHEAWYTLDLEGRKLVHDLAAFLRIAEALDRSHRQVVRDLRVMVNASNRDNKVLNLLLSLHEAETAQSEIWALGEKKAFFEMHFQVSLDVLVQADALVSAPPHD